MDIEEILDLIEEYDGNLASLIINDEVYADDKELAELFEKAQPILERIYEKLGLEG